MVMQAKARRWDPVIRLTHWSVVLAVLANAIVTEEGSAAHVWVGYTLAGMLGLRLLWGLVGPSEARFSAFPPSLRRALDHFQDIRAGTVKEHASHNPLGALMVYAIWSCLLVIIGTGIAMAGLPASIDRHEEGSVGRDTVILSVSNAGHDEAEEHDANVEGGGDDGEEGEGAVTEVHELAANLLYLLILLHIAGVVFETRRSGRQVVLAMLPGHR